METQTNYILKVGIYSFFVNVTNTDTATFIHIGGKKRCISMIIYHNHVIEADLHSVFYSQHCDRNGRLEKETEH
jgi:hypothetical protein